MTWETRVTKGDLGEKDDLGKEGALDDKVD